MVMADIMSDIKQMVEEVKYIRKELGPETTVSDAMQIVHASHYMPKDTSILNNKVDRGE